ncbi:precorrin-2 C(20)-methyltransferase [Paracoccus sp. (in: a-proteobacteria)]|uniref:precorrin-2 C(20)-methyltransferase n=1 Tax=Paracoccus sp. TaxID=267 RepID=UPI002AFFA414|nr:precorrin-2 C(20)-methyltransferase [Paracoccus sp. (in: a-proteobacteria)]
MDRISDTPTARSSDMDTHTPDENTTSPQVNAMSKPATQNTYSRPEALLHGIGLGPGNPDYMTIKARRLLDEADLLVHFCKAGERGNARRIVDAILPRQPERELALPYPLTTELPPTHPEYRARLKAFYEESAERLAQELAQGRRIGVLCEGDPFFYGSFMHLWRRLAPRFPTEVVPAVSGMSAAWTHADAPITWGDDILTVLPGTLPEEVLAEKLRNTDAAVIMKLGRNLPKVRRALHIAGLEWRAIYAERVSMAEEKLMPLSEKLDDDAPYFSMILVPGEGRRP